MEVAQQQAPGHVYVRQGRVEESEVTEGGRVTEDHGSGLSGLWDTCGGGLGFQVPK